MIRAALPALLWLLSAGNAWACLPGFEAAARLQRGGTTLAYQSQPAPIPLGQPFALDIAICPAPRSLAVDAHMPAHRHGMNYQPSITNPAPGRYRAEGLVLHMPGAWEFVFELGLADGQRQRLTAAYQVQ